MTQHRLTDAERAQWDVDPDRWPHTPPFHVFRALMDADDNTWWRAGEGHGLNAYEAAVERVEELEAQLAEAERLAKKWNGEKAVAEARLAEVDAWREEAREHGEFLLAAERERDEWRDMYAELNGAISWDTTCLNCASLLDRSYADYVRAEAAEPRLAEVEEDQP